MVDRQPRMYWHRSARGLVTRLQWDAGETMSDIAQLEPQVLADLAAANDEAALEAVRVAALGKSGSVSALLKTLGTMTPDERKAQGR